MADTHQPTDGEPLAPDAAGADGAAATTPADPVRVAQDRFVEAWGTMGSVWGISRTMAQVHALLYVTGEPMCTDDIMERLGVSRGNASMSMRALLDWGVVSRAHKRGDRKEYFEAEQDVWTVFRSIVRERMKREIDPLLASLHEIGDDLAASGVGSAPKKRGKPNPGDTAAATSKRVEEMLEFLELCSRLGHRFTGPSGAGLRIAVSLLGAGAGPKDRAGDPEATSAAG